MFKIFTAFSNVILLVLFFLVNTKTGHAQNRQMRKKFEKIDGEFNKLIKSDLIKSKTFLEKNYRASSNDEILFQALANRSWHLYFVALKNVDSIRFYFPKTESICKKNNFNYLLAQLYLNQNVYFFSIENFDSAAFYARKSILTSKKTGENKLIATCFSNCSNAFSSMGNFEESNKCVYEGLTYAKDYTNKSILYSKIADNFNEIGNPNKCKEYYMRGIDAMKKSENKALYLYKQIYNLADFLRTEKEYNLSNSYGDSILFYGKNEDANYLFHLHKSQLLKEQNKFNEALKHINFVIEYDLKNKDDYNLALDYKDRGQINYEMKNNKSANEDFVKALSNIDTSYYNPQLLQLLRDYVGNFIFMKDEKAYRYYNQFLNVNDSLMEEKIGKSNIEMEAKYKNKEQKIALESSESKNKLYFFFTLFFLLISILLYHLYKKMKIKNSIIENQKLEILHNNRNNIQQLISIFGRQANTESEKESARENQERLLTLNLLNRLLYENTDTNQAPLNTYLQKLAEIKSISHQVRMEIKFDQNDYVLDSTKLKNIGLIINELISNSIKYAFENVKEPKIKIDIATINKKEIRILYNDNGNGLPKDFDLTTQRTSFGIEFIKDLVEQMHGNIEAKNDNGARFEIKIKTK